MPSPVIPAMIGDRDLVDQVADQGDLLVRGEEGALTRVAQDDQALDAVEGGQPLAQAGQGRVVDVAVDGERRDRRRVQSTEIES